MPKKNPSIMLTRRGSCKAQKQSKSSKISGACTQMRHGSRLTNHAKNIEPPTNQGLEGRRKGLVSRGCKAVIDALGREKERLLLIKLLRVLQTGHRIRSEEHTS